MSAVSAQRKRPPHDVSAKPEPAAPGGLPGAIAAGTVFLASGAVLVLEILAVRLLAPYVGLTLETTTSIIGAALAGIALGAACGGHFADRHDPRRLLAWLLVTGGFLTLSSVPVVRTLGPGARSGGNAAALGITLLALVPGATVLSAVSPTVARMQLHDLRVSGRVVGRLSAWATAGAILGTFGTGFVLVPLMPVSAAVLLTGLIVVVVGLLHGLLGRRIARRAAIGASAISVALGLVAATRSAPCDAESTYQCARVIADPGNPHGRELVLNGVYNSYVDLGNPRRLVYPYVRWIAHAIDATSRPGKRLDGIFVGGGGFTLPRWLVATHAGSSATVLEVDKKLVGLDKQWLGLKLTSALRATVGDARMTLRREPSNSADIVVGDAYGSAFAVPWHLTTMEWFSDVRRVLKPGGLYAMNIIDMGPLKFLKSEAATLLASFRDVQLVAYLGPDGGPGGGNAVFLASDRPLPDEAGMSGDTFLTFRRPSVSAFAGNAKPLTDDYAPVDQLVTPPKE